MRGACYVVAAALLGGSGLYLALGADKGLGIFLVLVSAILSRVLVLDVAARLGRRAERPDRGPGPGSNSGGTR